MNSVHDKEPLTLGEFIMVVYDTCEEPRAAVIVWLAIHARLVCCKNTAAYDCPDSLMEEAEGKGAITW